MESRRKVLIFLLAYVRESLARCSELSGWKPPLLKFFPECSHSYLWMVARGIELKSVIPSAECLEKLGNILSQTPGYESYRPNRFPADSWEWNLRFCISDSLEKLGFLYFARDQIKNIENSRPRWEPISVISVKYHIYNFIFDCKAFLDALGSLLNYHFNLGLSKGDIDFNKSKFRQILASKNMELSKAIEEHLKWIKELSDWRIKLIHRQGILVFGCHDENGYSIPKKPLRYTEYYTAQEKGSYYCVDLCQKYIEHAQEIFDASCKAIVKTLRKHHR